MSKIIVTGIGTGVGKTIVSSIFVEMLRADYWKPVQCGLDCDTDVVKSLVSCQDCQFHPEAYRFNAPVSPHQASKMESRDILIEKMILPKTSRSLIIETVGGLLVPLNENLLTLDLFIDWDCEWIVVSQNYLGSINHTLLTLGLLSAHRMKVRGVIFNGVSNTFSEEAILSFSKTRCLGRLNIEQEFTREVIKDYAKKWSQEFYANN